MWDPSPRPGGNGRHDHNGLARRSGPSASTAALVEPRGRRAISIALMLALSFGGLVLVAVVMVLAIGLWTGRQNAFDHLKDEAALTVSTAVAQLSQHLEPAKEQLRFLVKRLLQLLLMELRHLE